MPTKLNKLLIGIAVISLTSAPLAFAQAFNGKGPDQNQAVKSNSIGYGLTKKLNLDKQQEKQVQIIMKQQRKESRTWRKQHRQETEAKLSTVLNTEQMEKFKALKQQRRNLRARKYKQSL
ncbi:MAG: hypothetical protein KAI22_02870 [Gammaproteobacteria bacterium]|nr:hypothetical protein [Gammaproteobacteria bacterium]